ncbi:thioesterase [Actinosynnema pretiosum subsp. pretiosum]|uniref:Thioesterase n=1 Tax=Actinosynnema pretiosum subsp. pretiosum TaxID=103721 RepID=A0AA45L7A0_9PSEU|nr:thioesterase [Actinosynnema pretiosum subsp. pretiosum]
MPPPRRGKWLLRAPDPDARARLFCFPYSGLGASMYGRWPRAVGDLEVCAVQPPGRENRIREPHHGGYPELADLAATALLPHLDRPFAFFGHCGGALAAFATAARLAETGEPVPTVLFASSQVAPHEGPFGRFLSMSDAELSVELGELTRALGGVPDPDMIELGLGVLRADLAANRGYRLDAPLAPGSDVCAVGWSADAEIRPDQMGGWRDCAPEGGFTAPVLDGGHHAFLAAPEHLLAELELTFTRSLARHRGTR